MFERFRRGRKNRDVIDQLYAGVVERARQPRFFLAGGLPDTVMGRFDSLSIEMFLFLHRCRQDSALSPLAQDLVDRFMTDLDHSIREIGIGYMAVPKRMRKLAGLFYQRVRAFSKPVEQADRNSLEAAVASELFPEGGMPEGASDFWADHILAASAAYARIPDAVILAGEPVVIESRQS
ncbi:hypothetical protein FPY71_09170 [Aureimonas fodinaquatilis]|uniref:Ubiquinol-cytochrome c chaperone domain-containing protein n=1 Tax=Aureimonas fodinaquatilis TaxID=2565783 RepID=A0A5B0DVY4_9HYPH|nr:ubiquinol-cytochrome C chaperone family protein [Aureimonas fodinaquatilis]KAA0970656.1 hypothetical protein FPY71_09170 [Aureimonas fodinaquatilis]